MNLLIISGRSGAGKTICLNLLEDLGYYCIDNLPIRLLPDLVERIQLQASHVAVSIDARNFDLDAHYFANLTHTIKNHGAQCRIIYFDAHDRILVNRFNETRRKHPLASRQVSLEEALQNETQLLSSILSFSDLKIDTSHLTVQQLRELIRQRVAYKSPHELCLFFESFGYKFGMPPDADFIFDARCLSNPYWHPKLRSLTGLDTDVAHFLQQQPNTQAFLDAIVCFLESSLKLFQNSERMYLTIAVGCTGGQHRSVYLTEQLAKYLKTQYPNIQVRHRHL